MARRPPNDGASWSARELKTLKALAKAGTPTSQVAKKLGRTAAAVQQKAMRAGISFRAAKHSLLSERCSTSIPSFKNLSPHRSCCIF